ncbi:uncharacterized protein IUM83_07240 [Phytophthora cinnamomi]|uniref:uncharacterized protein n=1 Tax=Phytophthora cinnamomi TaxID=4785 RepID=UPI00355A5C56|nr:hypothetical protein IUM83_07240 [Phytophthora cinnamomi]
MPSQQRAQPRIHYYNHASKGDSLDRVNERFGLVYERGALTSTKETLLFHSKRTYEEPTFFSFTTSSPAFRRRRST